MPTKNCVYEIQDRGMLISMNSIFRSEHTSLHHVHGIIQSRALDGLISITINKDLVVSPFEHELLGIFNNG